MARAGAFLQRYATRHPRRTGLWIYVAIASFAVCALGAPYAYQAFAFTDVGSDTFFQFYPLQIAAARQLRTLHEITWSFDLGLGGYLGSMFDPLWLITGWLPDSAQLGMRLPLFAVRLVLGGALFCAYLQQLRMDAPLAVLGGLGYALSSYGVVNAQWDVSHGAEFVQLAAFLLLLERYLHGRGRWNAIGTGIVVGLGHPFGLFQFALFGVCYATARLSLMPAGERVAALRSFAAFAAWCLPGLALTAPLLLPAAYYLLDSPRVSGSHSLLATQLAALWTLNDRMIVGSELAGLVGKDLLGTASNYRGWLNYFEGPGFYVGLLPLLCIAQLGAPAATKRERALLLATVAGTALYFAWPALRLAVYGFGHIVFRFSTLWISILLLVCGLCGLRRATISGWWLPGVALGVVGVATVIIVVAKLHIGTIDFGHAARVAAFVLLYATLAAMAPARRGLARRDVGVLVAIGACELLVFAVPPMIDREAVSGAGVSINGRRYDDDTLAALAWIRAADPDERFYRIEKAYSSVFLDDALVQHYAGTASYYFHGASITRFVDRLQLPREEPSANYISPMIGRRDILDLLAVRYVLAHGRKLDAAPRLTYLATVGNVTVYRNDSAHEFATFYGSVRSERDGDAVPVPQRDAFLASHVVVADPASIAAGVAPDDGAPAHGTASLQKVRDDLLSGTTRTAAPAVLLIAMPFDRGWRAWLDAEPLRLFRADYGLTAALVPAGNHALTLGYSPPGRALGIILAAGIGAFLLVFEIFARRASREAVAAPTPGTRAGGIVEAAS